MALKFLNKKGWHTGSLRNIENVWKAEQKHAAEEKKLDEFRKHLAEERERSEFRELQEKAGLVPKQERLEFLYNSGLAVGHPGGSDNFKEAFTKPEEPSSSAATAAAKDAAPGALFAAEKPQSANDAWRKLHSDPLLMIKQREQEALARIKKNPVQMAMIRKQIEVKKPKEKECDKKEHRKKHRKSSSKHQKYSSDSEDETSDMERKRSSHRRTSKYVKHSDSEDESHEKAHRTEKNHVKYSGLHNRGRSESNCGKLSDSEDELRSRRSRNEIHRGKHSDSEDEIRSRRSWNEKNRGKHFDSEYELHSRRNQKNRGKHSDSEGELLNRRSRNEKNHGKHSDSEDELHNRRSRSEKNRGKHSEPEGGLHDRASRSEKDHAITRGKDNAQGSLDNKHSEQEIFPMRGRNESHNKRRFVPSKLSEEERAARLKEMQMDAELHEEQRWKRLKKADEKDAQEATQAIRPGGKNFLDAVQTSVYGSGKGGSSTIEESVRRRTHYLQGRSEAGESNAFRR